jgi:hypothetical protein
MDTNFLWINSFLNACTPLHRQQVELRLDTFDKLDTPAAAIHVFDDFISIIHMDLKLTAAAGKLHESTRDICIEMVVFVYTSRRLVLYNMMQLARKATLNGCQQQQELPHPAHITDGLCSNVWVFVGKCCLRYGKETACRKQRVAGKMACNQTGFFLWIITSVQNDDHVVLYKAMPEMADMVAKKGLKTAVNTQGCPGCHAEMRNLASWQGLMQIMRFSVESSNVYQVYIW